MSLMEKIFGKNAGNNPNPPAPAPAPAQPSAQNNPTKNTPNVLPQQTQQTDANGVVPQQPPESPLAKFEGLWSNAPSDKNSESSNTPDPNKLTPERLMEAAAQVDFSKIITQDSLAKITAGGEDAAKELVNILNTQSKTVYGRSMVAANAIIEQAVQQATDKFSSEVPGLLRRQSAQDALLTKHPSLSNAAIKPVVEMIQAKIAEKHPNASEQELQAMAEEYFLNTAKMISPQKQESAQEKAKHKQFGTDQDDWTEWLNPDADQSKPPF